MRVTGKLDGDIAAIIDEERTALAGRLRTGMEATAAFGQADLRGQVRAAGLGNGLEKAWRQETYPRNRTSRTLGPGALIYSKAALLHAAFAEGAVIRAGSGRYLAIPTREAEALGLAESGSTRPGPLGSTGTGGIPRRVSMVQEAAAKLGEGNIAVLPSKAGRKLVVYRVPAGRGPGRSFKVRGQRGIGFRRGATVPLFILVPQVRLRARLDMDGARARIEARLVAEIGTALAAG